jgi:type II protein arginine methyltransferase
MTVNFASNVGVALEITEDLPTEPYLIDLWRSEPVQTIVLPTKIFLTLDDGTPYLSAAHKILIQSFLQLGNISITLRPVGILTADNFPSLSPYMEHLRGVYHEALTGRPEPVDAVLFPPTQPLRTNLTESEYEHFELDVKKYNDYEAAIRRFIIDRQSQHDVPDIFVAAVVGCGRGPLVTAVLNSALDLNAKIRIYALEKNPLTVGFLEEKCRTSWEGADVRVVMEDMRTWQAPEMLDILLSELLGSFGDNELSPECLAGPEKYLKGTGVSIPARYTSYLCPISSEKIYELFPETERRVREHVYGFDVDYFKSLDEPQPVFAFSHPSSGKF